MVKGHVEITKCEFVVKTRNLQVWLWLMLVERASLKDSEKRKLALLHLSTYPTNDYVRNAVSSLWHLRIHYCLKSFETQAKNINEIFKDLNVSRIQLLRSCGGWMGVRWLQPDSFVRTRLSDDVYVKTSLLTWNNTSWG